jgi:hypothetical protein
MAWTHKLVSRNYWWPKINRLIWEYVKSCDTCARSKAPRHRLFELLRPLSIPTRPWGSITMDFIMDLPIVKAKDSILVVVDRLTKMAHFTPCSKSIMAEESSVNSGRDCLAAWTPRGNCVRQRPSVCIQILAAPIRTP